MKNDELLRTNKVIKKVIYLLSISIILIFAFNSSVLAQDRVNVTFTTDAESFNAGDEIEIKVNVSGEAIRSIEGYIIFDENIMEYVSMELNSTLIGWNARMDLGDPYYMTVSKYTGLNLAQDQYVATLKFKLKSTVSDIDVGLEEWAIVPSAGAAIYQEDDPTESNFSSTVTPYGSTPVLSHDVTYDYQTNGGIPANTTASVNEGSAIDLTAPTTDTKAGWTFVGWNTDSTATTGLTSLNMGTSDIILYAIYSKDEELYLTTDKYKIGNENTSIYETGDSYITRISPNTTLKAFLENCHSNGEISVLSKGTVIQSNELIGTGMILKVEKDTEVIELEIAVTGDLDGNGSIGITDLIKLRRHLHRIDDKQLTGVYLKAGDVNEDNQIGITDLIKIRKDLHKVTYIE